MVGRSAAGAFGAAVLWRLLLQLRVLTAQCSDAAAPLAVPPVGPAAAAAGRGEEDCSSLLQLDLDVAQHERPKLGRNAGTAGTAAPRIFVAMMSRRGAFEQRAGLRGTWHGLTLDHTVNFVVCDKAEEGQDALEEQSRLLREHVGFGDLLFLDCYEGYNRLTEKTAAMIERFARDYGDRDYFIKVDDDCFVAWRRFEQVLVKHAGERIYMGTPLWRGVVRDPSSEWYQPEETYGKEMYPKTYSGASYTLSGDVARLIVREKLIDHEHLLTNEDAEVGLWVYRLVHWRGVPVTYVDIPGTLGYSKHFLAEQSVPREGRPAPHWPELEGPWARYPNLLHHKLQSEVIRCLAELDAKNESDALVDPCFALEGRGGA